jgi:hypothetical protein
LSRHIAPPDWQESPGYASPNAGPGLFSHSVTSRTSVLACPIA